MFDDLRDISDQSEFAEEPLSDKAFESYQGRGTEGRFLGMTRGQRLVIALLLLGTVIVLGTLCLLVTGKVAWPP